MITKMEEFALKLFTEEVAVYNKRKFKLLGLCTYIYTIVLL